jgi:hypothetical protein
MTRYLKIFHLFAFFSLFSCEKSNNTSPNMAQYIGIYDAEISGGLVIADCKMEITQNGSNLRVRIHDNGNEIDPDIFIDVRQDSNNDFVVIPCNNNCYQGDADITGGSLMTRSNGKIRLQFYVQPIGGFLGSIQMTATEI